MAYPGPELGPWVVLLLLFAVAIALIGEAVRILLGRFSSLLARPRPIERILIDLYLGGGAVFLLAAVPLGLFYPETVPALVAIAAAGLIVYSRRGRKDAVRPLDLRRFVSELVRPMPLVALLSAITLFGIELAAAMQAPTGNTYDSSLLTYYVAGLIGSHSIPTSFLPATPFAIAYPQGTTVWLASYQTAFALPPTRTSILVTPLFAGLCPLGAYVVGDRLVGRPSSGAVLAIVFAFVGSWTRVMAAGSNDFVFAFPLVLLLVGRSREIWLGADVPRWGEAIAFGGLAGVSATLNPVGPIWLFLTVLAAGLIGPRPLGGRPRLWLMRWIGSLLVGVAFAIPSLYQELVGVGGHLHAGVPAGAIANPATSHPGISFAQFIGMVDPYLVRSTDVWFSPFPAVRDELIVLLTIGALLLLLPSLWPERLRETRAFARFAFAGGAVAFLILLGGYANRTGASFLTYANSLTSLAETSILLFTIYTMVAALPIVLLVRHAETALRGSLEATPRAPGGRRRATHRGPAASPTGPVLALALATLLVVPGAITTGTGLVGYQSNLYRAFGNVSAGDFALFDWVREHVAAGDRVLVAQGSAAEFLSGAAPQVVVLYPMVDMVYVNGSYEIVSRELENGTLDAAGERAMAAMHPDFIAVTGANNQLFRPWLPTPFLAMTPAPGRAGYLALFHAEDAYLFERVPSA